MIYLLYYDDLLLSTYGDINVLRLGLLVLIYNMLSSNKLSVIAYKKMENYLLEPLFSFDNIDLKNDLVDINIKIEIVNFIKNGEYILNKIKKLLDIRFNELDEILTRDIRITATIPGKNALNHKLGTIYKDDWNLINNNNDLYLDFYDYVASKLLELVNSFGERIKFGDVYYQNADDLNYQVWSANLVNYNLKDGSNIPGDLEMKIQGPGVFGIVTTPRYGF